MKIIVLLSEYILGFCICVTPKVEQETYNPTLDIWFQSLSFETVNVSWIAAVQKQHLLIKAHILAEFGAELLESLFLVFTDCLQLNVFILEAMELLEKQ